MTSVTIFFFFFFFYSGYYFTCISDSLRLFSHLSLSWESFQPSPSQVAHCSASQADTMPLPAVPCAGFQWVLFCFCFTSRELRAKKTSSSRFAAKSLNVFFLCLCLPCSLWCTLYVGFSSYVFCFTSKKTKQHRKQENPFSIIIGSFLSRRCCWCVPKHSTPLLCFPLYVNARGVHVSISLFVVKRTLIQTLETAATKRTCPTRCDLCLTSS